MVIDWGGTIIVSVSYIPEKIKIRLWGTAAGRCQYEGCNKPLWLDTLTKYEFNVAYIAHIIADSPDGPRGDPELSFKLKADISNLMLMCDEHHRLIDREDVVSILKLVLSVPLDNEPTCHMNQVHRPVQCSEHGDDALGSVPRYAALL